VRAHRLTGVYIHLPFCDVKCAYCDFFSIAERHVDAAFWEKYTDRLITDLQSQLVLLQTDTEKPVLASIFFGGGTPSRAPAFVVARLVQAVKSAFAQKLGSLEITAEANPESLSDALLAAWFAAGVNRVSVGMQSLDEKVLKYLGRLYNPQAYAQVLGRVSAAGFTNFSADFITGVPGQTVRSTLADLDFALANGVTHLSLYQLTVEPGTLLRQRIAAGRLVRPSENRQVRQMDAAVEYLERRAFERYEISNFAKAGKSCRHNRIYWTGRPYLGLGVAAHMYTGNRRFFHVRSLDAYMQGGLPTQDETVSQRDNLINLLRLRQRVPVGKILRAFERPLQPAVTRELAEADRLGWLTQGRGWIKMTHSGLKHTDSLLARLWNL
jgi:oxygen-independent coproporphyrinogen-3 oxidase